MLPRDRVQRVRATDAEDRASTDDCRGPAQPSGRAHPACRNAHEAPAGRLQKPTKCLPES